MQNILGAMFFYLLDYIKDYITEISALNLIFCFEEFSMDKAEKLAAVD